MARSSWLAPPPKKKRRQPKKLQTSKGKADSETEAMLVKAFEQLEIPFQFQVVIPLTPPSQRKTPKVRLLAGGGAPQITLAVDFIWHHKGVDYYIDTKGVKASDKQLSRTKYHLLKHKLLAEGKGGTTQIKWIYAADVKILARMAAVGQKTLFIQKILAIEDFH